MGEDLNNKSSNEIILELKQMEIDYEVIKSRMINDFEKLKEIEKLFNLGNDIIIKRLKGN